MDDFIGIIVLAVIYMVAAASFRKGRQGQKKKRAKREAAELREHQFDEAFQSAQAVFTAASSRKEPLSHMADADCERKPLHLHEVTQQQFAAAGEGEDPCHAGHAPEREQSILLEETPEPHPLADDVLRGVIMSEILQRPCDRMARRDYRRRA